MLNLLAGCSRLTQCITTLYVVLALVLTGGSGNQIVAGKATSRASNSVKHVRVTTRLEPPSSPGKYGGSLTDAVLSEPQTLNLCVAGETSSTGVVGPLYDSLNSLNLYTLQWQPALADLPHISADGLTWTYQLKPNLKWSDGQPLTADDVIFTLDVIYDPNVETFFRYGMMIELPAQASKPRIHVPIRYHKVDERTVEFKFPGPYAPAGNMLAFPIAPRHKLEAAHKAGQFNSTWGVNTNQGN